MSSGRPKDELPSELVAYLSGGRLVVAATIDDEDLPYTMVMNSATALDARTIRFCIDHRAHSLRNLRANGRVMFEVVGDGFVYGVRGRATVVKELMDHAPSASAMVQVDVDLVKRDLPPGVESQGPRFRWGALERYMAPIEPLMFEEMRAFSLTPHAADAAPERRVVP